MNRILLLILVLLPISAAAAPGFAVEDNASAAVATNMIRQEKRLTRDRSEGEELVTKYCTGCHSEARIMSSLQAMHGEQGRNYESQVKSIILRKIRITKGEISRQDGRKIIAYLVKIWQQQKPLAALSMNVSQDIASLSR